MSCLEVIFSLCKAKSISGSLLFTCDAPPPVLPQHSESAQSSAWLFRHLTFAFSQPLGYCLQINNDFEEISDTEGWAYFPAFPSLVA